MKMKSAALALLLATGIAQAEEAPEAVNINEADSQTLAAELDGVGPVKAEAIVEFRKKEGEFVTPEHLEEVNGIGTATLDSNRERIRVD
ncbi:competence protein ComEA [Halospina denitrificans]|uniref:Competence protein ComEA n=1 Tax=Halospina denitrificans TaxID=332522 RepID=A0A4R7JXN7_9GAMM|nr:helix-hairpin-helix domain-containing protein [Halospina denitrificans]TDT43250.1 competence protein ComEA [Halospina denitrificans]